MFKVTLLGQQIWLTDADDLRLLGKLCQSSIAWKSDPNEATDKKIVEGMKWKIIVIDDVTAFQIFSDKSVLIHHRTAYMETLDIALSKAFVERLIEELKKER